MEHLTHGGDIYSMPEPEKVLDFSVNVNPLGIHPSIKQTVVNSVDNCERYPDPLCRELVSAIAAFEDVSESRIVCGNGAADIIYRLVQSIKPKRALLFTPCFSEYERALQSTECQIEYSHLREEDEFILTESVLDVIHSELDMVFVCNPNNPTGLLVDPELTRRLLDICAKYGILLFADECFNGFLSEPEKHSLKPFLASHENLFILKSFTKLYAIPGLRLGYGMGSADLMSILRQCGQEWSVSIPAQAAGIAALGLMDYAEKTRILIAEQREWLSAQLTSLGMKVYDSKANYVFAKCREKNLKEYLIAKKILIRSCGNYQGLSSEYYRFAVLDAVSNQRLVSVLEEALKLKEIVL